MCNIQLVNIAKRDLTVTTEAKGVVSLPSGQLWSVVVAVAFSETTVLLSNAGETTSLPAFVHGLGNPVDPRVPADSLVTRVNEDDLVIFVYTILVNPIRVQYPEVTTASANTLFRDTPQSSLGLEVVHTLTYGFAIGSTLRDVLLAVASANADTVDNVSLLGLVSQPAGLVRARRASGPVNDI